MNRKNKILSIIILFIIIWLAGSVYYYTCSLKGLCSSSTDTYIKKDISSSNIKNINSEKNEKVTRKYTCSLYLKKDIKYGAKNELKEVAKLENFLIKFQNADIKIDGIYSKQDNQLIKDFQKNNNQAQDGFVGKQTRELINTEYCKEKVKEYKEKNNK